MRHLHLSDVQSTNLQLLHVILVGAQRDLVETCRKFHLHATQAERLRTMQPSEIWSLVHAVGDASNPSWMHEGKRHDSLAGLLHDLASLSRTSS